ncbi:MAG: trans-aconitate 2-methyltransferase [Thermoleophilia bacterium]
MIQQVDTEKLTALIDRAVGDLSAGYGGVMVRIGDRLGLYAAMAGAGPLTPGELAARAGCAERYVAEWLNAQAAGGYVEYHAVSATYELTAEGAMVLADPESPVFVPPAWDVPAAMFLDSDDTIAAFRTGHGVPWGDRHHGLHEGIAGFYRNAYRTNIAGEWIPALDGVAETLALGGAVADVGCGHGHSSVAIAEAFPAAHVDGIDNHAPSIDAARLHAEDAGVTDRVAFTVADAQGYPGRGYDLICFFDALHDMGDPEGVLAHAARALAPGGVVMLVEPYAGDRVEDNLNSVGRLYYSASTAICLAHGLSEGHEGLGAQAGEARLAEVCRRAGLTKVRRAAATPFNLILEARV